MAANIHHPAGTRPSVVKPLLAFALLAVFLVVAGCWQTATQPSAAKVEQALYAMAPNSTVAQLQERGFLTVRQAEQQGSLQEFFDSVTRGRRTVLRLIDDGTLADAADAGGQTADQTTVDTTDAAGDPTDSDGLWVRVLMFDPSLEGIASATTSPEMSLRYGQPGQIRQWKYDVRNQRADHPDKRFSRDFASTTDDDGTVAIALTNIPSGPLKPGWTQVDETLHYRTVGA